MRQKARPDPTFPKYDLKNTDLYLYRVSNGLQIAKHTGLDDSALTQNNEDHYVYRFPIPGSRFSDPGLSTGIRVQNRSERREAWQDGQNIAEELRPFNSDHLRPGEQVKIIAINRPTGYIGTTTTVAIPQNGLLDIPTDKLIMRAPNLKLWAERIYTPSAGLSKDQQKRYTIGFEGSALTSDTQVLIHSQWFEHDGSALPEDLEGYTGRMAKVTGPNSLAGGDVATFSITPGSHLQLVRFQGDILGTEHFYVHVSGYPEWENPGIGAASQGPLQYRPKNYVPIKVPVFDEAATRQLRNLNTYNQQDGAQSAGSDAGDDKVAAVYRWPFRPELQFSVFELVIKEINCTDANNNAVGIYPAGSL